MTAIKPQQCAYPSCVCVPPQGETVSFAKEAGTDEIAIARDCGHPACSK